MATLLKAISGLNSALPSPLVTQGQKRGKAHKHEKKTNCDSKQCSAGYSAFQHGIMGIGGIIIDRDRFPRGIVFQIFQGVASFLAGVLVFCQNRLYRNNNFSRLPCIYNQVWQHT